MWNEIVLIAAINVWIAWRYSKYPIGPDEGMWMLWGWTGAKPYIDFYDCKPPGIHLWFWLLAHLTGKRIWLSKLIHHLVIGACILGVYVWTGSLGAALLATCVLQSGWLLAHQSWLDAFSAAFFLLAIVCPYPTLMMVFFALSVLMSIKMAIPGLAWLLLTGHYFEIASAAMFGTAVLLGLAFSAPDWLKQMYFGVIELPRRLRKQRSIRGWYTMVANATLIAVPAMAIGIAGGASLATVVATAIYLLLSVWGKVHRPNHWLPVAILAASHPDPLLAGMLLFTDLASMAFLLKNPWEISYYGIYEMLNDAEKLGNRIRSMDGILWVNTWHVQLYVYAHKFPCYQIDALEIRDVAPEIKNKRDLALAEMSPDLLVVGPNSEGGTVEGYKQVGRIGGFELLA